MANWRIREAVPDDVVFMVPYWRAGYEHAPEVQHADRTWYRVEMSKRIAWCLEHGKTLVACLDDDADGILGFANASKDGKTLHYVAVRKEARGVGVAKALLGELPSVERYSHRPYRVPRFAEKLAYCPFVFSPEAFT